MLEAKNHPGSPKSLADVLEEEFDEETRPRARAEFSEVEEQKRLTEVYRRIHSLEIKRSALCLSGGGIRSASFGLGVLQALARARLLEKFDYLSTVSGGGYIGGWLSAWIHHHQRGREGVFAELRTTPERTLEPESDPIRHLRAFSNYLTPQFGLFSADTWTIGATVLRDILLNWIVLLSWLAAVLLIPRFCLFTAFSKPGPAHAIGLARGCVRLSGDRHKLCGHGPPEFREFALAATPLLTRMVRPHVGGGFPFLQLVGRVSQHQ